MLKLSMKPTGWFQIGWSAEIAPGATKAMKYFGEDMVAFRTEDGKLVVMDAHCKHLGAHLAYGGKVKGDCIACPYHGWEWNSQGANIHVPYQDKPTGAKLRTRHIIERHGIIFMWHDPAGGAPREGWELPDLFTGVPQVPAREEDFYPCYPHAVVDKPGERIHPQMVVENAPDTTHFHFTHGTPECPELLWFDTSDGSWRSEMGFKSPKTKEVALSLYTLAPCISLSFTIFNGQSVKYRLILTATPVDEETSDFRVNYFFPRDPASPDVMPESLRAFARQTVELFEEDARMWRHQIFVQRPVFAKQDIAGYTAMRKWSERFYEAAEGPTPMRAVEAL
ncbi:phenylpropionate dioxygenase-like ring-hydroxylating dioxygenase large terminal subunit [Sphingobium wenxiniae]|nr:MULTISPECIES: Rieske 2Fe-2S domain-containing protein [Sphingobium]KMS61283.1 (2Fe-2S)-binding protein [Sphingobium baderi LL03]MBB6191940.1 phenylpropionate dioxygenase-like ring-hydroxylating dioxygenase large terminal subunit [Sphingobium wenxiniae]TWH96635.1 phenylpropionate dioxygenase-like ring-hydroxylating dioxygenase large terminal subunit [Sphingobium wenxiniae]